MDSLPPTEPGPAAHCPHAGRCPGCPAIDLDYPAQLKRKRDLLRVALSQFDNTLALAVPDTVPAQPITGYRTRAKLVADASGALGLYEEGSHEVVDTPECVVLEPWVAACVATLRTMLRAQPVLEGVDVVRVERGVLVTLIARRDLTDAVLEAFAKALQREDPHVLGVAVSRRASSAVQLLGSDLRVLTGLEAAPRRLAEDMPEYSVAHGGFVQAHDGTAAEIQHAVVTALEAAGPISKTRVLELYAGAGSLSLWLAQQGAHVTSVEAFKPACERLAQTAQQRNLTISVIADDAARALHTLSKTKERFDAVVVNPPRRGLDVRVRKALAKLAPRLLLYVSCNPATLARDLSHLSGLGLRVHDVSPFDMMPLTNQVETLAVIHADAPTGHAIVYENEPLLALDKAPHLAVQDGEHSLLEWVHTREGWERAVPLLMLDVDCTGVVLFARNAEAALPFDLALLSCTRRFQVLAKGITHGKGRLSRPAASRARYVRSQVVGGHSLLDVTIETALPHKLEHQLSVMRHPIIGHHEHGDARTNLHFSMRHGLDRAFMHCAEVSLPIEGSTVVIRAPLAPDLTLVLASLAGGAA